MSSPSVPLLTNAEMVFGYTSRMATRYFVPFSAGFGVGVSDVAISDGYASFDSIERLGLLLGPSAFHCGVYVSLHSLSRLNRRNLAQARLEERVGLGQTERDSRRGDGAAQAFGVDEAKPLDAKTLVHETLVPSLMTAAGYTLGYVLAKLS